MNQYTKPIKEISNEVKKGYTVSDNRTLSCEGATPLQKHIFISAKGCTSKIVGKTAIRVPHLHLHNVLLSQISPTV